MNDENIEIDTEHREIVQTENFDGEEAWDEVEKTTLL